MDELYFYVAVVEKDVGLSCDAGMHQDIQPLSQKSRYFLSDLRLAVLALHVIFSADIYRLCFSVF